MPKKKLSDMVFQRIGPPDHKTSLTVEDLSNVLVRRLGLKRKESRADHSKLLLEFIKFKKENLPLSIQKISEVLGVSQSQTYEEIRKWRSLGLVEFVKIPSGEDFIKGYMLTSNTANRLIDRVEAATKSFMRKTRRIAKDFDDLLMLGIARAERPEKTEEKITEEGSKKEEIKTEDAETEEEEIIEDKEEQG
jgi:Mn-dependent DtxR family transcriptional regulator